MKYIYFEHHWYKYTDGSEKDTRSIENYNVLLNKPNTNSGGVWGRNFITEHKNRKGLPWYNHIVDQYWIDLEKFYSDKGGLFEYGKLVRSSLKLIIVESRDEKLEELIESLE